MSSRQTDRQRRTDEVMYFLEDHSSGNVAYYGRTDSFSSLTSDPVWQIKRIVTAVDGSTETIYANNGKYTEVWDDRDTTTFPVPPASGSTSESTSIAATVVPTAVPLVAGNDISSFFVVCDLDQAANVRIEVSLDSLSWIRLSSGDSFSYSPKGYKQIQVRSIAGTVNATVWMNFK